MSDVMEKLGDLDQLYIRSIERMYRELTDVMRIVDIKGRFIAEFAVSKSEPPPIDFKAMEGYEVILLGADPRDRDTITSIYGPFWTCDCKSKFVRHIADFKCRKCGARNTSDRRKRLPEVSINPFDTSWNTIVFN